jgi:hypothetical protein
MRKIILILFALSLFLISCDNTGKNSFIQEKDMKFYLGDAYFFPIGENIGWLPTIQDYEYYFEKLSENGGNTVRIIMVPWDTDIEWNKLGEYDRKRIEKLDKILDLAEKYKLKVILSLDIYGELRTKSQDPRERLWDQNPYNKKNGGPCSSPEEFFTNRETKESYKNRLRFILNKYKDNPNIFAYEFWNEVDITDNYNRENVKKWHKEMIEFAQSIDKNHLISTSFAEQNKDNEIWEEMDFVQLHYHNENVIKVMNDLIKEQKKRGKPVMFTEFSLGNTPDINLNDTNGEAFHDGLWISSIYGIPAFPWWWDEYINEKNLYYHFNALSSFWKNEELNQEYSSKNITLNCDCEIFSAFNQSNGFIYINSLNNGEITGAKLELGEDYHVEFWDTRTGQVILNSSYFGRVDIPKFSDDISLKLKKQ